MDFKSSSCLFLGLMFGINLPTLAGDNFCGGKYDLLSFIDRPSVAESPCVVPEHTSVLEMGYQYLDLTGSGVQQNLPEALYRIGLADRFEFSVSIPNYIHQTLAPKIGFTATALSVKHELHATDRWVFALEGVSILPSGSAAYGTQELGGTLNTLFGYNLTPTISLSGMLGYTSQSQPVSQGGQSYTSLNPFLVASWGIKDNIVLYAEVYGQTHTAPDQGSGYNMDTGISYLIKKNIALDLEVGKRLSGALGGFNQYLGTGVAIQMG